MIALAARGALSGRRTRVLLTAVAIRRLRMAPLLLDNI